MLKRYFSVRYIVEFVKNFLRNSYAINYQPKNLHDYLLFTATYFLFLIGMVFVFSYLSATIFDYKFHIPRVLMFMLFSGFVRIIIMLAKLKRKI